MPVKPCFVCYFDSVVRLDGLDNLVEPDARVLILRLRVYAHAKIDVEVSQILVIRGRDALDILVPGNIPQLHIVERIGQIAHIRVEKRLEVVDISPRQRHVDGVRDACNNRYPFVEQRYAVLIQPGGQPLIRRRRIHVRTLRVLDGPHIVLRHGERYVVGPVRLNNIELREYRALIYQRQRLVPAQVAKDVVNVKLVRHTLCAYFTTSI